MASPARTKARKNLEYAPSTSALVESLDPRLPGALILAYLLLTLISAVVMRTPGIVAHGNETTWDRAIFTAFNAATLTGFQQSMGVTEMNATGAGGPLLLVGLTLVGSLLSLFLGGIAAARILQKPLGVRQIFFAAITLEMLAIITGSAVLTIIHGDVGSAIYRSICAFGNSGLWVGATPAIDAPSTYLALLPLSIVGGLGLPVMIDLHQSILGRSELSVHSRTVLKLTAAAFLVGFALLIAAQIPAISNGGWGAWRSTLASCATFSINARTAGIPFESPAVFTAAGQWLLMLIMIVGASPAGTAGGLKLTTIWHLIAGTRDALAGRAVRRSAGIAAVWVGLYAVVVFIGMVLLAQNVPQISGDRLLFIAISATSNVGLSHDPIAITGPGLIVLSVLMLFGRLAPIAILWWTARTTRGVDVLV
jgi:trk system potassium uptake protein TrkH